MRKWPLRGAVCVRGWREMYISFQYKCDSRGSPPKSTLGSQEIGGFGGAHRPPSPQTSLLTPFPLQTENGVGNHSHRQTLISSRGRRRGTQCAPQSIRLHTILLSQLQNLSEPIFSCPIPSIPIPHIPSPYLFRKMMQGRRERERER